MSSSSEEPLHLHGRDLVLDYAAAARNAGSKTSPPPNNKIYFANFEQGEAALRELLSEYEADILSVFTRAFWLYFFLSLNADDYAQCVTETLARRPRAALLSSPASMLRSR